MFDRVGAFIGDKVGAVQGKLRADRHWLRLPGRKWWTIRRARRRGERIGRFVGTISGWCTAVGRWTLGLFF